MSIVFKRGNTLAFLRPSELLAALFRQLTFLFPSNFVSRLDMKKAPFSSLVMDHTENHLDI